MAYLPKADVLYDIGPGLGEPKRPLNSTERAEMVDRHEMFVEEMTKATIAGNVGETQWGGPIDPDRPNAYPIAVTRRDEARSGEVRKALGEFELAKGSYASTFTGGRTEVLAKEWTLTNPLSTGLIPYDLPIGVAA